MSCMHSVQNAPFVRRERPLRTFDKEIIDTLVDAMAEMVQRCTLFDS